MVVIAVQSRLEVVFCFNRGIMSKFKSLKRRSTLAGSADHTKIFNPDTTGQMEFTACVGSVMSGTNVSTLHAGDATRTQSEVLN